MLAAEDPTDGWRDAVVLEAGDGVLQLRWIVEPRSAAFVRHRRATLSSAAQSLTRGTVMRMAAIKQTIRSLNDAYAALCGAAL